MSAGSNTSALRVHNDIAELAPLFRSAVERSLEQCAARGLDAYVYEAYRTPELQAEYYARGRTKRPPFTTVTNAPDNLNSWHGYGLAVDVISRSRQWNAGRDWFAEIAEVFKANECRWGGDWKQADLPHFQWHLCMASPSAEARRLITSQGALAVWRAVRAVADELPARAAQVAVDALNLRPTPSSAGAAITVLARGTPLEVLDPSGSWFRVRVSDIEGYVHADYVALHAEVRAGG
jgi:peptidoglycan L-alanyl-D-glutamate endopeptidase CwlK